MNTQRPILPKYRTDLIAASDKVKAAVMDAFEPIIMPILNRFSNLLNKLKR